MLIELSKTRTKDAGEAGEAMEAMEAKGPDLPAVSCDAVRGWPALWRSSALAQLEPRVSSMVYRAGDC